jgi:type IV secretion system protein VirB2
MAFAGVNTPIGDILCTTVNWFTGNTGKGLATIAILTVGIWKLLGKISGRVALVTCVGIAILFGAVNIVDAMNAGAPAGCPTT